MNNKLCSKCKIFQSLDRFYVRNDKPISACKNCTKAQVTEYSKTEKGKKIRLIATTKFQVDNKENITQYKKDWYQENRDEVLANTKDYKRERMRRDVIFRLRCNISSNVCRALKGNKNNISVMKYLPYTISDLKNHLELQFDEHMNWNNYGSYWHIDHIIPQSLLPYASMEDENFKKCWNLDNLQPLEAIANIKKSNKLYGKVT